MIKINFNPFGHWLYDFWKQKEKEDNFIDYVCKKFIFDEFRGILFTGVCGIVKARGEFTMEDLKQIQELGIPLGQIHGFNLSGFRERTSRVPYDTFVAYLVNICDNKFTKEQVKQQIEYDN